MKPREMDLRSHLVLLVLVVALPFVIFSSVMVATAGRFWPLVAGGLLLGCIGAALVIACRTSSAVAALSRSVEALSRGEAPSPSSRSRVKELAVLGRAVESASRLLTERTVEREATFDAMGKLSLAVEQTADLVMICDRAGLIEYVNPAFEAVTGYSSAEVIGKTPRILKADRYDSVFYRRLWETILSGAPFREILLNRKKNGDLYYEEKTITPIRDARNEITHFVSTGKNITERYQAEEALRAVVEGTSGVTGGAFFQSLVKYLALALRVRYAFVGELIGEDKARLRTLAVWNGSGFGENVESVLADIPCDQVGAQATCVYPRGMQERFPNNRLLRDMGVESYLGVRLVAASGEVLGMLAVMDTQPMEGTEHAEAIVQIFAARAGAEIERVRAEEAIRLGEEQLRQSQKMDVVGQLAGGIAHDFNNLLTVMTGQSYVLLERLRSGDPSRQEVKLIKEAAERAAALTRQLLVFSRKQMLQPKVLDLNLIVRGMSSMLQRLIGEHIEMVTVFDPTLGPTRADPGQIEQVLVNLAVNARDAMPEGGRLMIETGNIELDTRFASLHPDASCGAHVMIRVTDTGTGIEPEIKARIFEPFFTTKAPSEGTGLGLSTAYGIVKQHGGYIGVESLPGRGTTFTVYLQRVQDSPEPVGAPAPAHSGGPGTETILLAEDEEMVRDLVRETLSRAGYAVLAAANGRVALQIAEQWEAPIHLLMTDVVMPWMSGRMLAERVRTVRPEIKVLYISGYDNALLAHDVLGDLLTKPFTPPALLEKVREVLGSPGQEVWAL